MGQQRADVCESDPGTCASSQQQRQQQSCPYGLGVKRSAVEIPESEIARTGAGAEPGSLNPTVRRGQLEAEGVVAHGDSEARGAEKWGLQEKDTGVLYPLQRERVSWCLTHSPLPGNHCKY